MEISAKRQKRFQKCKRAFDEGTLSRFKLFQLHASHRRIYLQKELDRKYGKAVRFHCENCAATVLYEDGKEMTDDELEEDTGFRRK